MATRRDVRRVYLILWTAFVALYAAAVALKVWQDWSHSAQLRRYTEAIDAARRNAVAASSLPAIFSAVHDASKRGDGPPPTTQTVARLLNNGQPLQWSGDATFDWGWPDEATGVYWQLQFTDGIWVGYTPIGYAARNSVPVPAPPPLYLAAERAIPFMITNMWRPGVVLALLTLATLPFHRAAPLAHLLLALALAWLLVHTLPVARGARYYRPSVLDQLPSILLMIGLSAFAMAVHHRPRKRRPGTCAECGYNLTGNVSGVCPECGAAVMPRAPIAAGNTLRLASR